MKLTKDTLIENKIVRRGTNISISEKPNLELIQLNEMSFIKFVDNLTSTGKPSSLIKKERLEFARESIAKARDYWNDSNMTFRDIIEIELHKDTLRKIYDTLPDYEKEIFWRKVDYLDSKI